MLPLPAPYPDELAYSILARFADRTAIATCRIVEQTFGFRASLSADLQAGADVLAASLCATAKRFGEQILCAHTTFNYYASVWSPEQRSKYAADLCSKKGTRGVPGSRPRSLALRIDVLRACSRCMTENIRDYGEPYWHRKHQLPGVRRCVVHQCELLESDVKLDAKTTLRSASRARFTKRHPTYFSAEEAATLKEIELCAVRCLDRNYHSKLVGRGKTLRGILFEIGVLKRESLIEWNRLSNYIENTIGRRVLKFVLGGKVGIKWLKACIIEFRPHRWQPIHIVLLTVFCEKWRAASPEKIQKIVTRHSIVPVFTEELQLAKKKYLALRAAGAKHLAGTSCWKLIRRWDPDWLASLPRRHQGRRPTIDWPERDRLLVEKCRACAIRIRAFETPVRVLPAVIIREIGFAGDPVKTPSFLEELARQTEPLDEWRKRKILFSIATKWDDSRSWTVRSILGISGLRSNQCSKHTLDFCAELVRERALRPVAERPLSAA